MSPYAPGLSHGHSSGSMGPRIRFGAPSVLEVQRLPTPGGPVLIEKLSSLIVVLVIPLPMTEDMIQHPQDVKRVVSLFTTYDTESERIFPGSECVQGDLHQLLLTGEGYQLRKSTFLRIFWFPCRDDYVSGAPRTKTWGIHLIHDGMNHHLSLALNSSTHETLREDGAL